MNLRRSLILVLPLVAAILLLLLRDTSNDNTAALLSEEQGFENAELASDEQGRPSVELSGEGAGTNREALAAAGPTDPQESAALSEPDPARRIMGQVVDADGLGVPEADVWLVPKTGRFELSSRMGSSALESTIADGQGHFSIEYSSKVQDLRLMAAKRGFQIAGKDLGQVPRQAASIQLELLPGTIISGLVVDSAGQSVAGAQVERLQNPGLVTFRFEGSAERGENPVQGRATSDEMGRFELAYEAPGAFALSCKHEDHPEGEISGESREGGVVEVTIQLPVGGDLVGAVRGIPSDKANMVLVNASPVGEAQQSPGARFGPPERRVRVSDDGSFVLRGLTFDREYDVWASLAGDQVWNQKACSQRLTARPGRGALELHYEAGASLRFVVTGADDGAPIEKLEIKHDWKGSGVVSLVLGESRFKHYSEGMVELENLRVPRSGSELVLKIRAPGYEGKEQTLMFSGGESMDLGTIVLKRAGLVVVTVKDQQGDPVVGAKVELRDPGGLTLFGAGAGAGEGESGSTRTMSFAVTSVQTTGTEPAEAPAFDLGSLGGQPPVSGVTDEHGRCELPAPDLERARLKVEAESFAIYRDDDVFLTGQKVQNLELKLSQGGELLVTVVDANGQPVAGQEVELHEADRRQKTAANGQVRFGQLPAGLQHAKVTEKKAGGLVMMLGAPEPDVDLSDWASAHVIDGELSELTIALAPTGRLRGTIRAAGTPLASASVSVTAKADEDGGSDQDRALRAAMRGLSGDDGRSDSRGRYELEDLEAGDYVLEVTHRERAMPYREEVRVRPGDNRLDLDLLDTVVSGRVRGPDGKPVAGVAVSVSQHTQGTVRRTVIRGANGSVLGGGGQMRTGEDGQYELKGIMPDVPLVITLSLGGYVTHQSEPFEVPRGLRKDDFNLSLVRAVELVALLPESPDGFVIVMARPLEGGGAPSMASIDGERATFDDLGPGTYTISRRDPSGAVTEEETVTLVAGQNREIRLDGIDD